ncbi:hypothetical protein NHQ30_002342 [Ciborinia camelliae]|nr:hypothetical protein NHQ30_002342 [Ciborinia camelliae]
MEMVVIGSSSCHDKAPSTASSTATVITSVSEVLPAPMKDSSNEIIYSNPIKRPTKKTTTEELGKFLTMPSSERATGGSLKPAFRHLRPRRCKVCEREGTNGSCKPCQDANGQSSFETPKKKANSRSNSSKQTPPNQRASNRNATNRSRSHVTLSCNSGDRNNSAAATAYDSIHIDDKFIDGPASLDNASDARSSTIDFSPPSTSTTVPKQMQNPSSNSTTTIPIKEQIATAFTLPRNQRGKFMPSYFNTQGRIKSKFSHLVPRRCSQCERKSNSCRQESVNEPCKSCQDTNSKCIFLKNCTWNYNKTVNLSLTVENGFSEALIPPGLDSIEFGNNPIGSPSVGNTKQSRASSVNILASSISDFDGLKTRGSESQQICNSCFKNSCSCKSDISRGTESLPFPEPSTQEVNSLNTNYTIRSRLGNDNLSDDQIASPLAFPQTLMMQYTELARGSFMAPLSKVDVFWELPCIEDEIVLVSISNGPMASIRDALDVPNGVLIKRKLDCPELTKHLNNFDFVKGILAHIICAATFQEDSIFGDTTMLRKTALFWFSEPVAHTFLQEHLRQISETNGFEEKLKSRCIALAEKMNMIMQPLIGANNRVADLHRCMAKMSNELHTIIKSYKGCFESILAAPGTKFDSKLHILEDSQLRPDIVVIEGDILMTTCSRVRYKAPGRDWRICAPEKVILAPPRPTSSPSKRKRNHDLLATWQGYEGQT